jgi:very-short-patch-repair endonuclease
VPTVELEEVVRRQTGVVTRAQALACGLSARTIARRAADGRWRALMPGVYLVAGHRLDAEARTRAAGLWGGSTAVVSGPTAAWWHGMLAEPGPVVHLTVPRALHRRARTGIVVHRVDLSPADRTTVREVALTARARTVLDTAVLLADGATFLDRALQRHVRFPALVSAHSRMIGRHGSAEAGRLLAAAADGTRAKSERILLRLLREAGISGWVVGLRFQDWDLDCAFPAARIAIELDGWAWHSDVERFGNDRRKGNALELAGWALLRFTWHDLTGDPNRVVRDIRAALRKAA